MSTETNTPAAAPEAPIAAPVVAPVAAQAPVVAQPPIAEPAKPGAKVEMTSDELKRRLDQSRASALADFIKGLGVTDEAALEAAVTEHKRLEDEKRTDLEKRDVRIKDLEPKAARLAVVEPALRAIADEQEAALTDAQKKFVNDFCGDDPVARISAIKAFREALPPAPIAPSQQAAAPAAQPKPPIQPGATTAPPPAPSPSGVVSPHVDHLTTWEALTKAKDYVRASQYYLHHSAAIVAAQKARS